jgi:type I restriction enzyme S subunit
MSKSTNIANELPKGWKLAKLGETGKIISGGTPSTALPEYWNGNINWISPADLTGYKGKTIVKGAKSITESGLKKSSARLMPKGSILFSSRAPIGYVVIAGDELCTNQGFKSIIPNQNVDSEFLYYFLKGSKRKAEEVASGTTFKEISLGKFAELEIPLPPKLIQQAIVTKIEELFSGLDKGIENLRLAQQQLKTYRQAVLKWAFDGKLTNDNVKEHELPKGWSKMRLEQIAKFINGDRSKRYPNRNEYVDDGIAFINTGHIEPNGKLDLGTMNYITREKFKSLSGGKIEKGDMVYCLRGATIGKIAFVDQFSEGAIASSLVIIRPHKDKLDNRYLFYYLKSPLGKECISQFDNGSAQPNLSAKSLSLYNTPIPGDFKEQSEIVQAIESRLSVADKMEESISQSLQQSEALRQSILKKAFEGRLV